MIDIKKLSALEKAATPGPWYAWRRDGRDEVPHSTDGGIFTMQDREAQLQRYIRELGDQVAGRGPQGDREGGRGSMSALALLDAYAAAVKEEKR